MLMYAHIGVCVRKCMDVYACRYMYIELYVCMRGYVYVKICVLKVKMKKVHLNTGANRKKYINIGQYVFKSYQFKMLNFTKCYAVFWLWNNA